MGIELGIVRMQLMQTWPLQWTQTQLMAHGEEASRF
jgi:hypothetical protein